MTLHAPALAEPLNALSAHLSGEAFDAYRKRLAEWLNKAYRLRDDLIVAMRDPCWVIRMNKQRRGPQRSEDTRRQPAEPALERVWKILTRSGPDPMSSVG